MKQFQSSVSPKGQITLPLEVRRRWRLRPKDRVTICVDGEMVTVTPSPSPVDESYGVLPPLPRPMSVEEMTRIAAEEHARQIAEEGR